MATPLFLRVAFEECLVQTLADKAQRLFLKRLRIQDAGVGLRGQEGPRLIRAHGGIEELVDGVQVDRQRIDPPARGGLDLVLVGSEGFVAVDIIPDLGVIGVKDVRAVDMHHHPGFGIAFGMAIACDMRPRIDDGDLMPRLGQMAANHCTRQSGTHHQKPAHHAMPFQTLLARCLADQARQENRPGP